MTKNFRYQPWFWAIAFAVLIALATVPRARKLHSPDFQVFYVAAQHVLTDPVNLYKISPDRYLYPPTAAILLVPFSFSEHYTLHQWVWHGFLACLVWWLTRASFPALAAMVLLSRYLAITFGYGQINVVIMALMAAAAGSLRTQKNRAGALWALAVSLKVYPAVFAPAFLPKENRKGILPAAATGLFLLALPFLVFGPSLAWQLHGEFLGALESKGLPLHSHNQSFAALLLRLFTGQSFYLHAVGDTQWTLLALSPAFVKAVALGLGVSLAAVSWWRAWRRPEDFLPAAAFCFLFLSHLVWKDYFLFLFFPLARLFFVLPKKQAWFFAGAFLAMVTLSSPDVVGAPLSTRFDGACIHLWAAVLVWIAWLRTTFRYP